MKGRFALRFLLTFTVLIGLWWQLEIPRRYRLAALATTQLISPIVNGWWLDYDQPGATDAVVYRRENVRLPMLLDVSLLSMSLMPFLSLVAATPGMGWRRGPAVAAIGVASFFLFHQVIVLTYPWIMDRPNFLKDTLGIFSGLVAFVVGPLGLWFTLTYPTLRSVWRLDQDRGAS